MEDDEYELVSSEEVDRLKREIERLKSNPFVQSSSDSRLYESVRNLNESVAKLYVLFENVNKQLMKEYQTGESPEDKIDKLLDQNRNIAEALVSLISKNEQSSESSVVDNGSNQTIQNQNVSNQNELQNESQTEIPMPAMQQPMQIRSQMIPDPFYSESPVRQMPVQVQGNQQFMQPQMQNMQPQMQRFNQAPQMSNQMQNYNQQQQPVQVQGNQQFMQPQMQNMQPQMQEPIRQQRFGFSEKIDPNYPTPDTFPGLDSPPSFGAPLNVESKKKGFLGFGKK